MSITHDVYQPLDQDSEVVGVCLGISKAFHKLWYKDFIHELELSGIGWPLLKIFRDFLKLRKQELF